MHLKPRYKTQYRIVKVIPSGDTARTYYIVQYRYCFTLPLLIWQVWVSLWWRTVTTDCCDGIKISPTEVTFSSEESAELSIQKIIKNATKTSYYEVKRVEINHGD